MVRILVFILVTRGLQGYPKGAPEEACDSLTPRHKDNKAQDNTNSPFKVELHATKIQSTDSLQVRIEVKEGQQKLTFKGLMVQGLEEDTGKVIGTFKLLDGLTQKRS